jgi:hypothetical protein
LNRSQFNHTPTACENLRQFLWSNPMSPYSYTWHRANDDTCSQIECDCEDGAISIRDRLKSDGIQCKVQDGNIQFDPTALFMKVIRICEPFIGVRLMSVHK